MFNQEKDIRLKVLYGVFAASLVFLAGGFIVQGVGFSISMLEVAVNYWYLLPVYLLFLSLSLIPGRYVTSMKSMQQMMVEKLAVISGILLPQVFVVGYGLLMVKMWAWTMV